MRFSQPPTTKKKKTDDTEPQREFVFRAINGRGDGRERRRRRKRDLNVFHDFYDSVFSGRLFPARATKWPRTRADCESLVVLIYDVSHFLSTPKRIVKNAHIWNVRRVWRVFTTWRFNRY